MNTIYPTHPNVAWARKYATRYLAALHTAPVQARRELVAVTPTTSKPGCRVRPDSLAKHMTAISTSKGWPLYADSQAYWSRLTRQFACHDLPDDVRVDRRELARRAAHLPPAKCPR